MRRFRAGAKLGILGAACQLRQETRHPRFRIDPRHRPGRRHPERHRRLRLVDHAHAGAGALLRAALGSADHGGGRVDGEPVAHHGVVARGGLARHCGVLDNLPSPGDGDTDLVALIRTAWKRLDRQGKYAAPKSGHRIFQDVFSKMNLESRAALISIDFLGFDEEQAAYALGLNEAEVCKALSAGRKILINGNF